MYADAGFAVAIDDVIHHADAETCYLAPLAPRSVYKILLQPSLEVALARNAARTNKDFHTSILVEAIRGNHRSLGSEHRSDLGWLVIDNGGLNLRETVATILCATGLSYSTS